MFYLRQQINQYQFPEDLHVTLESNAIIFKLPVAIPIEVKKDLFEQDFNKKNQVYVKQNPKQKSSNTYTITEGNNETKIRALLFILKKVIYNEKPIFEAEYIPPSLPANCFYFLSKDIPTTPTKNDIDLAKTKLLLDISQDFPPQNLNRDLFTKNPIPLTTEEVYLLLSIFNPEQAPSISGLREDENHDPQLFQLNMPKPVTVRIQYKDFNKYEMTFADNSDKNTADLISQQVQTSLTIIKSTECILATFSNSDEIKLNNFMDNFGRTDSAVAVIPDEKSLESELSTTYVEIFCPNLNENYSAIEQSLQSFFTKVELAVCKKCKLFYCPNATDEVCRLYFHKGKQIPFESGQMEEIEFDEEDGDEPVVYVNYTCCGECPKDEPPLNCGSKENGNHEKDESEGIVSKLTVERTMPGNIH